MITSVAHPVTSRLEIILRIAVWLHVVCLLNSGVTLVTASPPCIFALFCFVLL
jgi:hypothetical protein